MRELEKYKQLFKEEWISITESEIEIMIENIDNIWKLLFKKFKEKTENKINIKDYE